MNGVDEVYIYGGRQADRIEAHVCGSERWRAGGLLSPFRRLEFIRVSDAASMGDFLRDLDKRGLMKGDFLLVHGDLVANMPLDGALARHRARREANRDACMTMVLREAGAGGHRTKERGLTPVFVVVPSTGRCLHYHEMGALDADRRLGLDPELLKQPEFEIRADLIDCGIDICTPDVLALWSDSFDFELPRRNFLHDVLNDWELNGKLVYTDIAAHGYAARASSLHMYDAITRDVLGRWSYPFVPDANLASGHAYERASGGAYLEAGVVLDELADVAGSAVGRGTTVGARARVANSVVGRNCTIGRNARVEDCILWDGVTVADDAVVSRSILADSVVVGKACAIPPGSLLSFGVHVGAGVSFAAAATLSLLAPDGSPAADDTALLGPAGKGAAHQDADDGSADPYALQKSLVYSTAHLNLSSSSISTINTDAGDSDGDDEMGSQTPNSAVTDRLRLLSVASESELAAAAGRRGKKAAATFHGDAVVGLLGALRDDDGDFGSAKLEFMSLRFANDASDASVRRAVATALARRAAELLLPENGGLEPARAADRAVNSKGPSAISFVREVGIGGDGHTPEQVDFVLALQKTLLSSSSSSSSVARLGTLLAALLQQLYVADVLDEDGIRAWWGDERGQQEGSSSTSSMAALRERCRAVIDWLDSAAEEDDDDDDDDDDSDDD